MQHMFAENKEHNVFKITRPDQTLFVKQSYHTVNQTQSPDAGSPKPVTFFPDGPTASFRSRSGGRTQDCQVDEFGWKLKGTGHLSLKTFARIYAGWGVPRQFYQKEAGQFAREELMARGLEGEKRCLPWESHWTVVMRSFFH